MSMRMQTPAGGEVTSRPQTRESRRTIDSSVESDDNDELKSELEIILKSAIRMAKRNRNVVEFFVFLIFLALFTTVVILAHPGEDMIEHNTALRNAVSEQEIFFDKAKIRKVYKDIDSMDEYWDWLLGPFIHTLLSTDFPNQPGFFYPNFRFLGVLRLRQLRVQLNSCDIPEELASQVTSCIAEYAPAVEETAPYGPIDPDTGSPVWKWHSAADLGEGNYNGRSGLKFAGSGYNLTLALDLAQAKEQLQYLRDNRWIDVQTRVVFIDFLAFNANLNFLSLVKMATEFPASSGVKPYVLLRTAPISFLLPSEGGSIMFAAECLILVLVILYICVEMVRIRSRGWIYLADGWHYLDWINYLSFLVAFTLRLLPLSLISSSGFPPGPTEFINYERPMWAIVQWRNVVALNTVLAWLRLFKYAKSIPFMALLVKTLSKAAGQTLAFCSMLVVVYVGFSLAHHVAFGADLFAFRTLLNTMFALYRVLLTADFFDDMYASNRVLGPLLFFAWTLIGYFVLLHMFVAILNEAIIFAQFDLPKTTVTETVATAIGASKAAVSTVLHHHHATVALHHLNFRAHELPPEYMRTPAQHLLAEALDLERAKLEAEAEAHPHETVQHTDGKQSADVAARDGEVAQRLGVMEIQLFRAIQALKGVASSGGDALPTTDFSGGGAGGGGSRPGTGAISPGGVSPMAGTLRGFSSGGHSPGANSGPRSSFKLRHPGGPGVAGPTRVSGAERLQLAQSASPRGALITGMRGTSHASHR